MTPELPPLVPSLREENRISTPAAIILTVFLFIFLLLPWLTDLRELYRAEGELAAAAGSGASFISVLDPRNFAVVSWPCYPALVRLCRNFLPMETSLRLVSLAMLGVLAVNAGCSAARTSGPRAGIVAALCCFSTVFVLDKGTVGNTEAVGAAWLFSSQTWLLHYAYRRSDYCKAWIGAAMLLALAMLSDGPIVLVYFFIPLLLLKNRFKPGKTDTPAFKAAVWLFIFMLLGIGFCCLGNLQNELDRMLSRGLDLPGRLKSIAGFLWLLPIRFFPWSLLAWLPFCANIQSTCSNPGYHRYFRTIFLSTLLFTWLLFSRNSGNIFYLIGPLAVLIGCNYEAGVRRYGVKIRQLLWYCRWLLLPAVLIAVFAELAAVFPAVLETLLWLSRGRLQDSLSGLSNGFDRTFQIINFCFLLLLTIFSVIFINCRRSLPVWIYFLMLSATLGALGLGLHYPYALQEHRWRLAGEEIADCYRALTGFPASNSAKRLPVCLYRVRGLQNAIFYSGLNARPVTLNELEKLGGESGKFLLITDTVPLLTRLAREAERPLTRLNSDSKLRMFLIVPAASEPEVPPTAGGAD